MEGPKRSCLAASEVSTTRGKRSFWGRKRKQGVICNIKQILQNTTQIESIFLSQENIIKNKISKIFLIDGF